MINLQQISRAFSQNIYFLIKDKSDVISRLCYKLTVMAVDMIVRATVTNVTIYIFDRLMVCGEKKSVHTVIVIQDIYSV